ncbi:hypothetical protein IT407_01035 [Candidatus Uhrbacteria bacterium]|nr:hypothetical protein [Candidatus Uhrbacteria bacterium]
MSRLCVWCFFFVMVSACASGGNTSRRARDAAVFGIDASTPRINDAGLSATSDSGRGLTYDAASPRFDGGSDAPVARSEICNGRDDDLDGSSDENFGCPLGRMGEICVTSCGANGYRVCEEGCHWSSACRNFSEQCNDTLDNDCDGTIDEGCSMFDCESERIGLHLRLAALPSLGECEEGWTLVLWGAGGRFEEYRSEPGRYLEVDIGTDWGGWSAMSAYCGSWDRVRRFETMTSASSFAAGISISLDGHEIGHHVLVCYDPVGMLFRPLIPIECGLDPCPGPSY